MGLIGDAKEPQKPCWNGAAKPVSATVADEAFRNAVLPWTTEARSLGLDAETLDGADHLVAEVRGTVEDQIARRETIRKSLAKLLGDPRAAGMPGDVAVQNAPPVMDITKKQ